MIRKCTASDFERIYEIINHAAQAYKGVIPAEYWNEPYMSRGELRHELDDGIVMWGFEDKGELVGVMGIQHIQNVTLIRHSYVCTSKQNQGIGGKLLSFLKELTEEPILIATWSNAVWAIRFYEKHGFRLVSIKEGYQLQKKYWSSPEIKVKTSVVLADEKWFEIQRNIMSRSSR
jgi:RimJ/RimL family protein N-acetyltransferase